MAFTGERMSGNKEAFGGKVGQFGFVRDLHKSY